MSELTPTERMNNVEALLSRTTQRVHQLRTFDELDAVVEEVFGEIQDLEDRITSLENNLGMIESILPTTNG